jgi:hypothetical protein
VLDGGAKRRHGVVDMKRAPRGSPVGRSGRGV